MSISDLIGRRSADRVPAADLRRPGPSRATVAIAALIPATLVTGWIAADAVQPARYSPVRQTVSVSAGYAGTHRWIMTAALAVVGLCYLVLAVTASLAALGSYARLGLVVAGAAALGVAANPVPMHGTAVQHNVWTAIGAITITGWPLLVIRRRGCAVIWPQRLTAAIVVTAGFAVLSAWLAAEALSGTAVGLAERVSSSVQGAWPAVVVASLRPAALSRTAQPTRR
jgi:Protein of unknown function (DUF998)